LYPTTFRVDAPHGPVGGFTVGDGPPLVLVAGLGATSRVWGDLPLRLARKFLVIAPDNRGVGRSRDGDPFTIDGAVDDLEAVLDAHGADAVSLLGVSLGGTLALALASARPRRIGRLVAVSCTARPSAYTGRLFEQFATLLTSSDPAVFGELLMTLAFAPEFHRRFPGFVNDTVRAYGPAPDDVPGTLDQLAHLGSDWDLTNRLERIAAPVLLVAGELDPIVPPEETAEIADRLAMARLVTVPGAAHSVLLEGGRHTLDTVMDALDPALPPNP
jgi:pimeloyl-ACP methyl ester carboxylesterase